MATKPEFLVGLDIGTARVAAVVVERQEAELTLIGVGTAPCSGVRRGVVANLEATGQAIEDALKEAELAAGVEIHSVVAGVGGDHIRSRNSHSVVAVGGQDVRSLDVERVLARARAIELPEDREVLHVLPRCFVVDEQSGVRDPVGMVGRRLEAYVHVVTTSTQCARNVLRCCARLGLHVVDLVLTPLASASAVLAPAEEELGVAVVDIGAGTTDVLVFRSGALAYVAVLPLGGHHVTSDIAAGLRTPFRDAELLKQRHGAVLLPDDGEEEDESGEAEPESIEVPAVGARDARLIARRELVHIIEARATEMLELARDHVARGAATEDLGAGVVLTGGMAALPGIVRLAERVFEGPVRLGLPVGVGVGSPLAVNSLGSPSLAAAVGLVRYGIDPLDHYFDLSPEAPARPLESLVERVQQWWNGGKFGAGSR